MTYKTDLQTNNTNLQSILDKVNALPEAGGGNVNIETCDVQINVSSTGDRLSSITSDVVYLQLKDGNITCTNKQFYNDGGTTLSNVVKHSTMIINVGSYINIDSYDLNNMDIWYAYEHALTLEVGIEDNNNVCSCNIALIESSN